jgi:hypothetical protein
MDMAHLQEIRLNYTSFVGGSDGLHGAEGLLGGAKQAHMTAGDMFRAGIGVTIAWRNTHACPSEAS